MNRIGVLSFDSFSISSIIVQDSLIYLSGYNGQMILNIADPTDPVEVGFESFNGLMHIAFYGPIGFLTFYSGDLKIYDFQQPDSAQVL